MIKDDDFLKRTVQIKRTFNAPIELVWEAWSDPEHIVQWWNPKGSNTTIEEHEFKEGGRWSYSMLMPNGRPFIAEGTYIKIVHHKTIISEANFKPMTEGVEIQSFFVAEGSQTHFTFNIVHPNEDYRIAQERMGIQNGWGSVFGRLDDFLNSKKI